MRLRHILGVAILCGAASTLGGQAARAQAPKSMRFVETLLGKEASEIKTDTKNLNTRDADISKLNVATSAKVIRSLDKTLLKLHGEILTDTTRLQVFSTQVYTDAALVTENPSLKAKALANLLTVQGLSVRAGLGIAPATPMQ